MTYEYRINFAMQLFQGNYISKETFDKVIYGLHLLQTDRIS